MQLSNDPITAKESGLLLEPPRWDMMESALPEELDCLQPAAGLLVMPPPVRPAFVEVLGALHVRVWSAATCREARKLLASPGKFDLVVAECDLADGNWCDVLRSVFESGARARFIVTTTTASETLWSELFWRGGYDVLVRPCAWEEIYWCLEGALLALAPPRPATRFNAAS